MRHRQIEVTPSGATREAVSVQALTTAAATILALFLAWSLADHFQTLTALIAGF